MTQIINQTFDQERALYGSRGLSLKGCSFDGPADGESALKESSDIQVQDCRFNLRYPFWHDHGLSISGSELTPLCRAALWYSEHIKITDSKLHGIKALRECSDAELDGCDIISPEFGWSSKNVQMRGCTAQSEYFMLRAEHLRFRDVKMSGKYSFQYIRGAEFEDCEFDTKDAFWHAENVVIRRSVVNGEYLGWYSKNVVFEDCLITGTQPLCYCRGLRLINCRMQQADLAFERSEVQADITTPVISIKNPLSGRITAPQVGQIIRDIPGADAQIIIAGAQAGASTAQTART